MKITFWGCDYPCCTEMLATDVSVDFTVNGWYMNINKETFCPGHSTGAKNSADEPLVEDSEINLRVAFVLLEYIS